MMLIQPCDNYEEWSGNLSEFTPNVFHSPHFLEALKNEKRRPVYFNVFHDNEIIAKLAGLKITSGFGRPIFHFYSGPCERSGRNEQVADLIEEFIKYARSQKINRVIFRSYDYCRQLSSAPSLLKTSDRSEFIVDLTSLSPEIYGQLRKSIRRNIKRAESHHPEMKEDSSPEMTDRLMELMKNTLEYRISKGYRKYSCLYLPYLDDESLRNLLASEIARLFYVVTNNEINCIQLELVYKNRAYSLLMGTSREGYRQGLSHYLDLKVMEKLKGEGVEYFNFGGVPGKETGLIAYKKAIGGIEYRMTGGSTNFLRFPLKSINPLLNMGRSLPNSGLKKILTKLFH